MQEYNCRILSKTCTILLFRILKTKSSTSCLQYAFEYINHILKQALDSSISLEIVIIALILVQRSKCSLVRTGSEPYIFSICFMLSQKITSDYALKNWNTILCLDKALIKKLERELLGKIAFDLSIHIKEFMFWRDCVSTISNGVYYKEVVSSRFKRPLVYQQQDVNEMEKRRRLMMI